MSKLGDSIARALQQANDHVEGMASAGAVRVHVPEHIDVKSIRKQMGLTQQAFARQFGLSINTIRHWEQGGRRPDGPARTLLMVIERSPDVVRDALCDVPTGHVDD